MSAVAGHTTRRDPHRCGPAHTHRHKTIAADSYWAVRASVARNPAAAALDDAFAKVSADNHVHDAVGVTANSGLTAQ